ncbi:hypothetical protein GDO78_002881 [Eleutherodactylus coqui]|uniref:Phosphatidylinositol-3-phosphatase SAC1 n=1 Tax=Eleutherodactylus coqui TaxID=57060 RepID=A0A8J6K1H2_ELECQ|nr:hypothetical protein GDO78_002881 [Eleutherodactylus coqui]
MYLVVITRKKKVGDLLNHSIWKATDFDIISYKKTILHLTDTQLQDNKAFLSMINHVLSVDGFYFSTSYDLTHTLQRLSNTSPEFQEMSLLERVRESKLLHTYKFKELIAIHSCSVNGKYFDWILISRRSCFRPGVRYYVRGIDSEGHAANFVETEQIVYCNGGKASFVQTRGSIPFFWSQRPNLKYKPKPQINNAVNHMDGFQRHFDSQIISYGKQVLVNLVNQKGSEKPLEQTFSQMVDGLGNGMVRYFAFDFHKECSHMRWDRLQILVDQVAEVQDEFGYFLVDSEGKVLMTQDGIFRSNCMDCLDRTNVIQSLLARRSLQAQLQDSIDLFLGNYSVEEVYSTSPLQIQKDWKFLAGQTQVSFPMKHKPRGRLIRWVSSDTWTETLAYVLFWGIASIGTATIILYNGKDFVDAPKLVQKEKMD